MDKELLEEIAEKIHNSWVEESKRQGLHHFKDCPKERIGCFNCHTYIRPYKELPENMKEVNRAIGRKVEEHLNDSKQIIVDTEKVSGLEIYCPKCNFDKKGFTKFEGLIAHACDPGCCSTLYCTKCGRGYDLTEDKSQCWDFKKQRIVTYKTEKYFKKMLKKTKRKKRKKPK